MGQAVHAATCKTAHCLLSMLMESNADQHCAPFGDCLGLISGGTGNILYADRHVHVKTYVHSHFLDSRMLNVRSCMQHHC